MLDCNQAVIAPLHLSGQTFLERQPVDDNLRPPAVAPLAVLDPNRPALALNDLTFFLDKIFNDFSSLFLCDLSRSRSFEIFGGATRFPCYAKDDLGV